MLPASTSRRLFLQVLAFPLQPAKQSLRESQFIFGEREGNGWPGELIQTSFSFSFFFFSFPVVPYHSLVVRQKQSHPRVPRAQAGAALVPLPVGQGSPVPRHSPVRPSMHPSVTAPQQEEQGEQAQPSCPGVFLQGVHGMK